MMPKDLNETITGLMELAQVDMSYTQAELKSGCY